MLAMMLDWLAEMAVMLPRVVGIAVAFGAAVMLAVIAEPVRLGVWRR